MAEIIFQRRKIATVVADPNPLIILLLLSLIQLCESQVINRAPHFIPQVGDMSQFRISEDTPVGTPVYQLKGVDPESGQLRYSISGQFFTVDSLTGVVTLAKALDRERQNTLEVIISITDEPIANTEPNTVSLRRVIPVKDVNDNPPIFHNRPYTFNISEATAVGTEIEVNPKIIITDKDEGENAKIEVVCSTKEKGSDYEACSTFRVDTDMISDNEYHVKLFLNRQLDFESRSAYVISLEASDLSGRPLKATASIAASIWDVQDQPPIFVNSPYSATVPENTRSYTSIMEIIAKDGDSANPRPVLLTLEGDSEQYFKLYPERPIGKAVLMASEVPLDRESDKVMQNGGVYNFFVKATELINNEVPSDYTVTPITIIVTDVDDHVPEFNSQIFNISIPENIENGSPIPGLSIYVEDSDLGQNSKYDLALRDVLNSNGVFIISPDHGEGRTPISIKVSDSSKLDYDVDDESKRNFSFDIVTYSNGLELSSARVNIKLLDINDNAPVFDSLIYKFNVLENSTVGTLIGTVQATDKDYGIFGEIEYTLTGFGTDFFKTDESAGGIYVGEKLDYEKQKSYSLTIFAKDGGEKESTASIFIDVIDVNDNAPIFDYPEYSRTIRDGATDFEPQFVIRATDADGPTQGDGRVKYTLIMDNSINHKGNVFTMNEETGEITIRDKVDSMDTPRGQYELVIRATDYGIPPLHNDTRVYIRVGVPGNQRPTFKGNYHNYNYITKPRNPESHEDYTYDLNPMNYKVSIREDAKSGENVTTVVATDPDGLDDLLTYYIVSGSKDNFVIDKKTGLITVSSDANLDRDINSDRYDILVSAVDSGVPIPETATTTVFVTIEDVNDKPPKFNMTDLTTYISEKSKIGELVTQMSAYDSDVNSKLKFSLIEPIKAFSKAGIQLKSNSPYDYKKLFNIDENTGKIFVNGSLDYNQVSRIILTIKVQDVNAELNMELQYAIMDYTIYIQPYADKNPQFTNHGWTGSNPLIYQKIKEEQPLGSTILVLNAEDPVSGYIVSNFKVINSETGLLQVDPLSGQVVLTRHLDYEELTSPNLTLTVMATSNDGSKSSMAKIIIEVINLNDNAPIFEKELYKVSVLESVMAPEQILIVKANDADAILTDEDKLKGFSEIRYLLKGENSDLFTINNITGVIQVAPNKTLDRERQSVLRLEIEAADMPNGGADQIKSTATILIDVLDVDDNTPTFEKRMYTAVVPENVAVGISVANVTATDPDEGLGGEIKYDLLDEGETNGYFTINSTSGEIKTRKDLIGKGRTDPYHLLIGAADGGGHTADASLTLYIGDVSANDGVPRFIRPAPEDILRISENATIGSPVYEVVASDPDDPTQPSGQLYYSIQPNNEDAKSFVIDPKNGLITTRKSLDREKKDSYTLVLLVTDKGDPPQQSSRIAKVKVTDVDDHKPHFKRSLNESPVLMTVKEEVSIGTVIGEIKAIDEDIEENAAIDYMITAGNELALVKLERTNDSKALILAAGRLDRETIAKIVLTIKCYKLGTVPKISKSYNRLDPSEIQLHIKILDIDDHLPEFGNTNITFGVRLNVPPDTVIGTLKAVDKDPDAPPVQYKIVNMIFESPIKERSTENVTDIVVLDSQTGELKIKKNLIHYADGIFRIVVHANNSKDVERYTEVLVEVVVVRERDLLRLVLDSGRKGRVSELRNRIEGAIASKGLKMQLHDAQHTEFYTNSGPCFQFRKADSGEALTPNAMKQTIRSLGVEFQHILETYNVHNITSCGPHRTKHTVSQHALLGLAAVLPIAAFIASIVLCCLHSNAKSRSRSAMLIAREATIVTPSNISGPTRLYAEPLYST